MAADLEALLDAVRPVEARISPDGSVCAVLAAGAALDTRRAPVAQLWLVPTVAGAQLRRLGDGNDECSCPRWSCAGDAIAFAARGLRVWRRADDCVVSIADTDGAIEDIAWAADDRSIMMLVADAGSDTAGADTGMTLTASAGEPADPLVVRPAQAWRRLVLVDLATRSRQIVSPAGVNVWEFDWRGGHVVALVSDDPAEGAWFDASVAIFDREHGEVRRLLESTRQLATPRLLDNGRQVAAIEGWSSDRGFVSGDVVVLDVDRPGHLRRHPLEASSIVGLSGGGFAYAGWRGSGAMCGRLDPNGTSELLWQGGVSLNPGKAPGISVSGGDTVVAITEGPQLPAEVRVLEDGRWRAITSFSPEVTAIPATSIGWRARDGLEIEGLVLRPHGGPAPLIVDVHGGPTDAWSMTCARYGHQTLLRRGYALLLPNPRGSCGRGTAFLEAVVGDPGGEDLQDIVAGIEHASSAGIAEPSRVGIMGGSYGGFMAAWATTQTDRFRAAVALAPVTDWRSFHFTSNIGRFDELLLQSDPRDPAGAHGTRSPLTHAHRSSTPTLLIHGELDRCTPPSQSAQFYNALAESGVETELVIYPREGHGWRERAHQIDLWRRIGDWFDQHMSA